MWSSKLIEDRVEKEIKKGFDSPMNGWSMSEIIALFEGNDKDHARKYIINRCNLNETTQ